MPLSAYDPLDRPNPDDWQDDGRLNASLVEGPSVRTGGPLVDVIRLVWAGLSQIAAAAKAASSRSPHGMGSIRWANGLGRSRRHRFGPCRLP